MSKLVEFAKSTKMSPEEFKDEIERNYAAIVDHELDKAPEGMVRQKKTTFGGYVLIIECFREFLD